MSKQKFGHENGDMYDSVYEEIADKQDQVEDPYRAEFAAFYATYEEGADYLYYRDDDDGQVGQQHPTACWN